jgi:hypothetical protein
VTAFKTPPCKCQSLGSFSQLQRSNIYPLRVIT